jgi:hypothetical protein
MNKKLLNEIERVKDLLNLKESDIRGIDELVYNPVTGNPKKLGFGYNGGRKIKGITWDKHDNHLHIGFTDKQVAIEVMDKSISMGLLTHENPYTFSNRPEMKGKSNVDRNNRVGKHSSDSFHYAKFDGTPVVGKGVDIAGDPQKIEELINWIVNKYANDNTSTPIETNSSEIKTSSEPSSSSSSSSSSSIESKTNSVITTGTNSKAENELLDKILKSEYLGKDVKFWLDINSKELGILDLITLLFKL